MGRNYRYVNIYVNTDVEVPMSDIMEQIDTDDLIDELVGRGITPEDKVKIQQSFGTIIKDNGIPWTLEDELKMNIIKEVFTKYSISELEQKLK